MIPLIIPDLLNFKQLMKQIVRKVHETFMICSITLFSLGYTWYVIVYDILDLPKVTQVNTQIIYISAFEAD